MSTRHPVHLILFSHPWCLHQLGRIAPMGPLDHDLLVELAPRSRLARVLGATSWHSEQDGAAIVLAPKPDLVSAVYRTDDLPAPILLAPRRDGDTTSQIDALSVLANWPGDHRAITALVHVEDAAHLPALGAYADRIAVLWDLADAPSQGLVDAIESLDAEDALRSEVWAGFHAFSDSRPVDGDTRTKIASLLQDFPAIAKLHERAA